MAEASILLAVPNVSEGRDHEALEAIERAFDPALFIDLHANVDHGRSVFTLAGRQGELAEGLVSGAREIIERLDLSGHDGLHPHVGALDVLPVVYVSEAERGAACAELLTAAGRIGEELELPVILYGELATRPENRERAALRLGGLRGLSERMRNGEVEADYGPSEPHPTAGVTLAAARPPLIAFNLDLETQDVELAREIAASIRESGGGLPGIRAMGLFLEERNRAQVSVNVNDYRLTPLRMVVEAVRERADIAEVELVGVAPEAAFQRFPEDIPLRGFSPERHLLENVLRSLR